MPVKRSAIFKSPVTRAGSEGRRNTCAGKMQMRPRGKPCGALGNTFDAKSYGAQRRAVCKSVLLCSTGLWKAQANALPHRKQQADTEQHKGDRTRLRCGHRCGYGLCQRANSNFVRVATMGYIPCIPAGYQGHGAERTVCGVTGAEHATSVRCVEASVVGQFPITRQTRTYQARMS